MCLFMAFWIFTTWGGGGPNHAFPPPRERRANDDEFLIMKYGFGILTLFPTLVYHLTTDDLRNLAKICVFPHQVI